MASGSERHSRVATYAALTALAAATIALASTTDASAACGVRGYYHLTSEGPWPRSMVIRSGDSCEQTFRAGGAMMFKRLTIVTQPRQGTLSLREGGYYRYATKAGARGKDAFTLRVCGEQGGHAGCANLAYDVTIQ
jgi:hypothetical protein